MDLDTPLSNIRGTGLPKMSLDDRSRMVLSHFDMPTRRERGLAGHRLCAIVPCQYRVPARTHRTQIHQQMIEVGYRGCHVGSDCMFVVERVLEDKRPTA